MLRLSNKEQLRIVLFWINTIILKKYQKPKFMNIGFRLIIEDFCAKTMTL